MVPVCERDIKVDHKNMPTTSPIRGWQKGGGSGGWGEAGGTDVYQVPIKNTDVSNLGIEGCAHDESVDVWDIEVSERVRGEGGAFSTMGTQGCVPMRVVVFHFTLSHFILQHTSTHCNTLEHTAIHCSTLQYTAVPLQRTATHCNTVCVCGCLSVCLYASLSLSLSGCQSVCLLACLPVCESVSFYVSVCLSSCLSV